MAAHSMTRKAGIIAAGRGERLRLGTDALKPLVSVSGQPLVVRVLTSLAEAAPDEVAVIINEDSLEVREVVMTRTWPFEVRWIVESTPSSMHSFLRVVETLASDGHDGPFLLSTVDTVAGPGAYRAFEASASALGADLVLAVNTPGDDEKPLLVRTGADGMVQALGSRVRPDDGPSVSATAGFYLVSASILAEAQAARAAGLTALRLFLERLLDRGYRLAAVHVAQSVDVDHPEDVGAAEMLLRSARS